MPDKFLKLTILSPEETVFDGDVCRVSLPGSYFPFEVLPGHAPIISALAAGNISWELSDGRTGSAAIKCGLVKVDADMVNICVEK